MGVGNQTGQGRKVGKLSLLVVGMGGEKRGEEGEGVDGWMDGMNDG